MIGIYDFTVILTYCSLLSASVGGVISLSGGGENPYLGIFCLMICGLCDAFDGKVASKKKNRGALEKRFGIQIDSLSDLVAFGVLPACIGFSLLQHSSSFINGIFSCSSWQGVIVHILCYMILFFYVLAALIRLAYFNVTEEDRQKEEKGCRKTYLGLPVTTAAIIFPVLLLVQYILKVDLTLVYFLTIFIMGFAFLIKFQLKKLEMRGILVFVFVGIIEFILLLVLKFMK